MVFALPENSVIKMKLCGRQARWQKLMPPRHKATDPYRRPLGLIAPVNKMKYKIGGQAFHPAPIYSPMRRNLGEMKEKTKQEKINNHFRLPPNSALVLRFQGCSKSVLCKCNIPLQIIIPASIYDPHQQ